MWSEVPWEERDGQGEEGEMGVEEGEKMEMEMEMEMEAVVVVVVGAGVTVQDEQKVLSLVALLLQPV